MLKLEQNTFIELFKDIFHGKSTSLCRLFPVVYEK